MKNTLNKYIVFIFLTLLISNLQLTAQDISDSAESKKVVATGTGSIFDNNIAKARDDAIEDALRRALEQTLGTMIEAETFVENYQVIDDNIFSETKGYIQNYQVVREQKRNDYLYEVMVTAVVSMENLQNDLEAIATLMRRKNMPRMMVMIDEKNIGKSVGLLNYIEAETNNAETAIIDEMMEKGFTFIDQSTVKQNLTR
ncbi:MAG: flagellar assembly protein T N-terminal domain-containing protein, partial [bacterium]